MRACCLFMAVGLVGCTAPAPLASEGTQLGAVASPFVSPAPPGRPFKTPTSTRKPEIRAWSFPQGLFASVEPIASGEQILFTVSSDEPSAADRRLVEADASEAAHAWFGPLDPKAATQVAAYRLQGSKRWLLAKMPIASAMPVEIRFDFESGVDDRERLAIMRGALRASDFNVDAYGGTTASATIHVIRGRTGGVRPEVLGSSCCAAKDRDVYLDIEHEQWTGPRPWLREIDDQKHVLHELTHVWQYRIGNGGCFGAPAGRGPSRGPIWIIEGWAEFAAYEALIADGLIARGSVEALERQIAKSAYARRTLRDLESSFPADANPYGVAYLAIAQLLDGRRVSLLGDFCSRAASGTSWPRAFESVFGIDIGSFYGRFEAARP